MKFVLFTLSLALSTTAFSVSAFATASLTDMDSFDVVSIEVKHDLPGWAGESTGNTIRLPNDCSIEKINSLISSGTVIDQASSKITVDATYNVSSMQDGSASFKTFDQTVRTEVSGYPFDLSCSSPKPISMATFTKNFENYVTLKLASRPSPRVPSPGIEGTSMIGLRCDAKIGALTYILYDDRDASGHTILNISTSPASLVSRKAQVLSATHTTTGLLISAQDSELDLKNDGIKSTLALLTEPGKGSIQLSCSYSVSIF